MSIDQNKCNFKIENIDSHKHISDMKNPQKEMKCLALYNPLTNIPNIIYAKENLPKIINLVEQSKFAAIVYININDFKNVNYDLGYKLGDKLIVKIVSIIKGYIKEEDMLCHVAIDRFAILVRSVKDELDLAGLVYSLSKSLEKNVTIENSNIYIYQQV